MRRRADAAVEPGGIRRAAPLRDARLPFHQEALHHHGADDVDAGDRVGMLVVVVRIAERRREHHRAGRTGLVMVVHDLREPLAVHDAVDVLRLGERRHVEVAVVVVAGVMVVQHRNVHVVVLHVPVRHQIHAIRVHEHAQLNHVVQEPHRFFVRAADHLPDVLDELLRAEGLRRVQPAVDPDDGFAFLRERARVRVAHALGERKPARDVLVPIDLRVVGRRRDDGHEHRPAFGRLADLDDVQAVRDLGELGPVVGELLVVGEEVVVADVVLPLVDRRRQARALRVNVHGKGGGREYGRRHHRAASKDAHVLLSYCPAPAFISGATDKYSALKKNL